MYLPHKANITLGNALIVILWNEYGVLLTLIAPQRVRQLVERVRILRAVNGHHRQMLVALLLSRAQRAWSFCPRAVTGAAVLGEEGLDFEVNALSARCQAGRDIQSA